MGETVNDTVKLILFLSISGGLSAFALFALKPFTRNKLSKSFQYYIWVVVLFRFILPLNFGINLMDFIPNAPSSPLEAEKTAAPNKTLTNPATNDNKAGNNTPNLMERQPQAEIEVINTKPFNILPLLADNALWIWLAGVIIFEVRRVFNYTHFVRYIHKVAYEVEIPKCEVKVFKSCFAPAPMLTGVIRPRIYLPDISYTDEQLGNILLHELTHLRRRDVLLKWLVTLCVSVHWFNPIVYFVQREINRACELSCDEAVIRRLDNAGKQSYGDTLISVVAGSRTPVGVMFTTMSVEKKKLKERLVAIMDYKKKTKITAFITVVITLTITCGTFAVGASIEPNNKNHEKAPMNISEVTISYDTVALGDVIQFGRFSWRVLEIQDGKMLIISEDILEHRAYDSDNSIWETSDIRSYLNGEFLSQYFTMEEQALISKTLLTNDDNPEYGTAGGDDTYDKLFLLSPDEVNRYFANDVGRIAYVANGVTYPLLSLDEVRIYLNADYDTDGAAYWWWLRTPGRYSNESAIILNDGSISPIGIHVSIGFGGLRPALWLEVSDGISFTLGGCNLEEIQTFPHETMAAMQTPISELSYDSYLDFEYMVVDGEATITRYIGNNTEVVIPQQIDGYTVVCIGISAFSGCADLTNVTIPNSVTSIEFGAFSSCSNLTGVLIPDSVTSIVDWAFQFCSSLTDITIPGSVTRIGRGVFYGCSSLTNITIPDSVTKIIDRTFGLCASLESVYFEGSAPETSSLAFHDNADNFTIYYKSGIDGWTTPKWNGYPAQPY